VAPPVFKTGLAANNVAGGFDSLPPPPSKPAIRLILLFECDQRATAPMQIIAAEGAIRAQHSRTAMLPGAASAPQIGAAAQTGLLVGSAVESFATALRVPLKRGRAGGLARARQVSQLDERWSDGRFMAHEDWEQIEREIADAEYMRYAAGGFARSASARRATDGTFLPRE
jgi:hypothetical protein